MDRSHGSYFISEANQRISNIKITKEAIAKNPERAHYKNQAITQCAANMARYFTHDIQKGFNLAHHAQELLLVPIPPSLS